MLKLILLLYVLAANNFVIPGAVWAFSWGLFALSTVFDIVKTTIYKVNEHRTMHP